MRDYDPEKPLIFIHVPKTAGTSVRQVLDAWFPGNYRHYFDEKTGKLPPRRDLTQRRPDGSAPLVFGHFNRLRGFGIDDYYPEVDQFVTLLRNPLDLLVSSYFYTQKASADWLDQSRVPKGTLEDYVATAPVNMLNHFPVEIDEANYKDIIERRFVEIGIMESLPQSMHRIAARLDKPFQDSDLGHLNASARDQEVSEAAEAVFRDVHALEWKVYDYVARRYRPALPQG